MRVISGKYKRTILKGFNIDGVRPTMDKVKESIFAMIYEYLDDSICLDLFSGTGSLGIEALSNGAKYVYFIDSMKEAINVTKDNLSKVNANNVEVLHCDSLSYLKKSGEAGRKFDIIFLDPPYGKIKIITLLNKIIEYDLLNENGIVVCEYEDESLEDEYDNLSLIKYRKYGKTYISIYKNMR